MKYGATPYRIMGFGSVGDHMGAWGFCITVPGYFGNAAKEKKRPATFDESLRAFTKEMWPKHLNLPENADWWQMEMERAFHFHEDTCLIRSVSVPGNACGLDPGSSFGSPYDNAYSWLPHNVDVQGQATALLYMWLKWFDSMDATLGEL